MLYYFPNRITNLKSDGISVKFLMLITMLFMCGCDMQHTSSKNRSIGAPGELLLVMDKDLQKSNIKTVIADFALEEYPCVPQPEPTFKMITISPNEFEGHFKAYRNIIIVKHVKSSKNEVKFLRNVWANYQQVLELEVNQLKGFNDFFKQNKSEIYDFLYYGDIKTMQKANLKGADAAIREYIKDRFGVSMVLPRGFKLVKDTLNFSWFRFDRLETIQSIVIHEFDLNDVQSLNSNDLVNLRDSVCKNFLPGPYTNSYMTTERALPVKANKLVINNTEVIELRGLWKVKGYFMGGPFVDYFIINKQESKLLFIEGFVHAPRKQNKAYYVRQIESILHSTKYL